MHDYNYRLNAPPRRKYWRNDIWYFSRLFWVPCILLVIALCIYIMYTQPAWYIYIIFGFCVAKAILLLLDMVCE